ncbi:DUF2298 domain-containing protein [Halospeciosus flavus]|uniref:DUF2298 domain-containing protein n=1 Tax=Halospeciosus flavus TaxID=3032283 RepID=A0ABD5Z4Q3_9EURY|nr:DUF2298 domain-containing protein [Halospeciosus flavus]
MQYGLVLVWWLAFVALGAVGLPLAARLLPRAPDRGAFVAIPLALVTLSLPVFWLGHVFYGPLTVLVGALVLLALSAVAYRGWRGTRSGNESGADLGADRRRYAEVLVVFTLAYLFLIAVRSVDAGAIPGGGEKFLDMGLLQSLLRADALPPEDMWFAGEPVVYYYGGHLLSANLATLTGTAGRYAYNLALAGFYAMEVTAAFGLAAAVARERGYPRFLAGVVAALFFGLASNLYTSARLLAGALPTGLTRALADALGVPVDEATVTFREFSYWPPSRVIEGTINEFPLFSYLNGDLHAHMMSATVLFLVLATLYAYWRTPGRDLRRRRLLVLGVLPPLVGVLTMTNTWSLPTALGLATLTLAGAPARPRTLLPDAVATRLDTRDPLRAEGQRIVLALLPTVVVAGLALAWVAPFVTGVLLGGVGGRHPVFWPDRSGLGRFLLVHGAFLAVFWTYLAGKLDLTPRRAAGLLTAFAGLLVVSKVWTLVGLALVGPLVVGGWVLLRRTDRTGFETLLLVAAGGLVVLVEFVYLADLAAPGRFNTVFKVYFQVWTMWAVVAGVAVAALCVKCRTWLPNTSPDRRQVVGLVFVFLVLSAVLVPYPTMALSKHFAGADDPTLDAIQFAHDSHPYEAEAIEWFVDTTDGERPHIVSRPTYAVYTWGNPVSSLTGIPTVVGWAHETGYRGTAPFEARATEVAVLYTTNDTDSRATLLDKYDVQYIYYGPRERAKYGNVTFASEPGLSVAFENEKVTVYAVNESVWNASGD